MSANQQILLSVVFPCYNPLPGWHTRLLEVAQFIKSVSSDAEILLVNDGSTQNFTEKQTTQLQNAGISIVSYAVNRGKGYALRAGVQAARGEHIIYTDIDFPYTNDSFLKIRQALSEGNDLAIGIRGQEYYTHLPASRVRISKFLRSLIRYFLRIPTDDTQCGLKGFSQAGKKVFLETTIDRYLFDLEFIFLSARRKLNIKTVEVELRPEITLSQMNWKILLQEFGNFLKIFVKSVFSK